MRNKNYNKSKMLNLRLPNFNRVGLIQTCIYRTIVKKSKYASNNKGII